MGKRFDERMKKLMKMFEKMLGETMKSSRQEKGEPDENFKTFEKSGPGFHMKVGVFNLTGSEQFDRDSLSKSSNEKAESDEVEKKARKLALKRFEEKKEKAEAKNEPRFLQRNGEENERNDGRRNVRKRKKQGGLPNFLVYSARHVFPRETPVGALPLEFLSAFLVIHQIIGYDGRLPRDLRGGDGQKHHLQGSVQALSRLRT